MDNIFETKKDQLQNKIGKIVSLDYVPKYGENIIHAYLWGEVPVTFVSTSLAQEDFNKLC